MSGLNSCSFIGRLGRDPEIKNLQSGASVANFSIAVDESYKDKTTGETKKTTEWINLVLWRGLADVAAKYLHKGDLVYVNGKFRTRSWEKDNQKHYTTEIIVDNLQMLSSKNQSQGQGQGQEQNWTPPPVAAVKDDYQNFMSKDAPKIVTGTDDGDLPF